MMQTLCCNVRWCPAEGAAAVGIFPLTRQSVDLWPLSSTSNLWHHRTIPGLPEGGKMWTNPLSTMLWVTRRSKVRHNQQHVDRNSVMYMCVCVSVSWLPGVSWLHLLLFYRHTHSSSYCYLCEDPPWDNRVTCPWKPELTPPAVL